MRFKSFETRLSYYYHFTFTFFNFQSPEKKQSSFKDAPSYIRTSLRKFKPKRNKSNTSTSSNENKSEDVTKVAEKTRTESITRSFKVEANESFFNTSLTEKSKAVPPVEGMYLVCSLYITGVNGFLAKKTFVC